MIETETKQTTALDWRTIKGRSYNEAQVKIMGQQKRRESKEQEVKYIKHKGQNFQNKTGNAKTECDTKWNFFPTWLLKNMFEGR